MHDDCSPRYKPENRQDAEEPIAAIPSNQTFRLEKDIKKDRTGNCRVNQPNHESSRPRVLLNDVVGGVYLGFGVDGYGAIAVGRSILVTCWCYPAGWCRVFEIWIVSLTAIPR